MLIVTHTASTSSPPGPALPLGYADGSAFRYLDVTPPVHFPESEKVPESHLHQELRTLLYQLLRDALGPQVTVGSDQFLYWDAEDPKQVLAPDVYVRLTPFTDFARSWKTWERGAPEVCVELVSESDASEAAWQKQLQRYRTLGTRELVRFDPSEPERSLRIWDRVEGRLLERELTGTRAHSLVLGVDWVVRPLDGIPRGLGIEQGGVPAPTRAEARDAERQARELERQAKEVERQAKEVERQAKEVERQAKEVERQAKEAAEARVRELEAELADRSRDR